MCCVTPDGKIETSLKLDPRYEHASEVIEKIVELNDLPGPTRTVVESSGIQSFNLLNASGSSMMPQRRNCNLLNGSTDRRKRRWRKRKQNETQQRIPVTLFTEVQPALENYWRSIIFLDRLDLYENLRTRASSA